MEYNMDGEDQAERLFDPRLEDALQDICEYCGHYYVDGLEPLCQECE